VLRQRLLTAVVLAPLFIAAIYLLPLWAFALVFAVVTTLGAGEWARLAVLEPSVPSIRWLAMGLALLVFGVLWVQPHWWLGMLWLGLPLWLLAIVQVLRYQRPANPDAQVAPSVPSAWWQGWLGLFYGLALLASAWCALLVIRQTAHGSHLLLMLFAIVWLADAGAYFAGRAFGRRALALQVSPGKTWEGALGGGLVSVVAVVLGLLVVGWFDYRWVPLLVVLVVVSVFGDLFESVLKRSAGMKDSGTLLPGHGGVLDRIDSIIAVLPFYALALLSLGLPPLVN
jgi:phosphatidate cytidylyltransferase